MTDATARSVPRLGAGDPWPEPVLLDGRSVVFFFPKADTTGCTAEAVAFSQTQGAFADAGLGLLGISRDPPERLARFAEKHGLTVPLHSDATGTLSDALGIWVEKSLYGKRFMGLERTTYLIGGDGRIEHVWRRIRVPGHPEAVLAWATGPQQAGE